MLFRSILLLSLAGCNNETKDPQKDLTNPDYAVSVSYCGNDISSSVGMDGVSGAYGGAVLMPGSKMTAKGTHIVGVRVGIVQPATDCELFISKTVGGEPIVKKAFTAIVGDWTYIALDSPLYLDDEDGEYFVGYTMQSTGYCVGTETGSRSSTLDYLYSGEWYTFNELSIKGRVSIQAMVAGGDYSNETQVDLAIGNLTMESYIDRKSVV